jgi:hypothetical protein
MLGRPFLFWTPLVMGAGLLIQLMAIESGRAIGGARPEVESP